MKKNLAFLLSFAFLLLLIAPHRFARAEEGSSAVVMEKTSGRVLYSENADEEKPIASTTKILTAIILIEESDLSARVKIPKEAAGVEGSSIYLKEGEEYTVEELLYGLMLRSGNDSAVALALHHSGSIEAFAARMNERAKELGATHSHFVNPHGLPAENSYSSARDLGLIACHALQNEEFLKIVSTKFYSPRGWENKNRMLEEFDGADGVKTGYTKQAGRCLVSSATRENMQLVCVVLNRANMFEDSKKLLSDAFNAYHLTKLCEERNFILPSEVEGKEVSVKAEGEFCYPLLEEEKALLRIVEEIPSQVKLPVKTGEQVGKIQIYLSNQLLFSQNLCSMETVEKTFGDKVKEFFQGFLSSK